MKSWYMTNYTPNVTGGFETDAIYGYAENNFTDILETGYADTALLYNENLTEFKEIKCIIQGNTADTQLKSMERILLVPINTVKAGMYIYFEDSYWIIDGRPGNNKSYEKATLKLCQYILNWQTSDGQLHSRPVSATSASKYDVGLEQNKTFSLASNNYCVLIGYDDASIQLDYQRVFIDRVKKNPTKVFKLTRDDDILYDYGIKGSILSFIVDRDEFNPKRDNQELRICDYKSVNNINNMKDVTPTTTNNNKKYAVAFTGGLSVRIGREKTWKATVLSENNQKVPYEWEVIGNAEMDVTKGNDSLTITVNDENAVGSIIKISIVVNGEIITTYNISIKEAW